jgi:general secretion pathway protein D
MGGLIYDKSQSFNDSVPLLGKIPFIGRLFRSEGSRSIKRNLMIFVKASTVDLDGETPADMAMN